ncbi:MAG: GntR family transcriptional regulator [Acidobacteriota bacterium]
MHIERKEKISDFRFRIYGHSVYPVFRMELTRLTRQRASDEVYQALRQSILSQLFDPGERLQVDEIADKLGVSLTPVRHAIQQLCTEGLVEIRPRSGTFVAQLTAQDVEETFDLRTALECLAAERAVERATTEQCDELRRLLGELARPVVTDDDRKRHEGDNRCFHKLLIEASGNRRLAESYEGMNAHLQIVRVHSKQADWAERLQVEQVEHEEIVAALEARDVARLQTALRNHIQRARLSLIAVLKG